MSAINGRSDSGAPVLAGEGGMKVMRKRILTFLSVIILCGCSTTGGFLGLATMSYVDGRFSEMKSESAASYEEIQAKLVRILEELNALSEEVEQYQRLAQELESILAEFARVQEATDDLQQLAKEVSGRMDALPKETLQELVEIIQAHLDSL
jgi:chromosome segregation ATPase